MYGRLSLFAGMLTFTLSLSTATLADFFDGRDAYLLKDYDTTVSEMRPLAQEGDRRAQAFLGWMYKNGYGVQQDINEAIRWYKLAAAQGHGFGQKELGIAYKNGEGAPRDPVRAAMWFNLSKLRNYGLADLALLEKKMDRASILRARRMANDWTARHKK